MSMNHFVASLAIVGALTNVGTAVPLPPKDAAAPAVVPAAPPEPAVPVWPEAGTTKVFPIAHALSGDTLAVGDVNPIRLSGIAAPAVESSLADEARIALARLIVQGVLTCTSVGTSAPENSSATLARCRVGQTDLGEAMLSKGWAAPAVAALSDQPWQGQYGLAYTSAVNQKRGQWHSGADTAFWQWSLDLGDLLQLLGAVAGAGIAAFYAVKSANSAAEQTAQLQRQRDDEQRKQRIRTIAIAIASEVEAHLEYIQSVALDGNGALVGGVPMEKLAVLHDGWVVYKANTEHVGLFDEDALKAIVPYHLHLAHLDATRRADAAARAAQVMGPGYFQMQTILRTVALGAGVLKALSLVIGKTFPDGWLVLDRLKTAASKSLSSDPEYLKASMDLEKLMPLVVKSD
jgi:endonuclease YncB( thermonuclease family)